MSGKGKNKGDDNGVEKGSESVEIKNIGTGNNTINSGFFNSDSDLKKLCTKI